MAFNHYAKLKRIIASHPDGWHIRRINQPTATKNFRGETVEYDYYYRLYDLNDIQIPYGKFQKLDKLARALGCDIEALPLID